jgi:hypothetical protein
MRLFSCRRSALAIFSPLLLTVQFSSVSFGITSYDSELHDSSQQPSAAVAVGQRVTRPELIKDALSGAAILGSKGEVEVFSDLKSGTPRLVRFLNRRSLANKKITQESLVAKAEEFIGQNPNLGLSLKELRLVKESVLLVNDVQSISFDLVKNGFKVEDASLIFHYKNGEIVQVINNSFSEALPVESARKFSDFDLESFVVSALLAKHADKLREIYRVNDEADSYQLVHVAEFEVEVGGVPYIVQVDVANRRIYEVKSAHISFNGLAQAHLYQRWYNEELTTLPLKELEIGNKIFTNNEGQFSSESEIGPVMLKGQRVVVVDKYKKPVTISDSNINEDFEHHLIYERDPTLKDSQDTHNDRMTSQAMIYYHATEIAQMAERYVPNNDWLKKPLTANANVKGFLGLGSCNAYWNGKSINFFKGTKKCGNTGLISDVVYHEWGHGYDENTGGIKDRSFSEGIGDIMSMVMTFSPKIGIGFMRPSFDPVRDVTEDKVYPDDKQFMNFHAEGMIIGSAFWNLYEALLAQHGQVKAADIMRNYAFKMTYMAARYTDVYDALLVIDDNDGVLENGSPNFCTLNKIFSRHGLAESVSKCS